MTKILIHRGKCNNTYFDVTKPEQEQRAYLMLFRLIGRRGYYITENMDSDMLEAYHGAKAGKLEHAKRFLQIRQGYEHEEWDTVNCVCEEEISAWID